MRRDLRGLSKEGGEFVACHLLAAGTFAEDDPDLAWRHARAARSKGGRIAVVRETVGLVAYRAGEWAEAISELRAARRMGGGAGHVAVMADCERALEHPEKAIEMSRSPEAALLDEAGAAELSIVVAGARADLGQLDAALVHLEGAGLLDTEIHPYSARLYYAYADLLVQAERPQEALDWFIKAADADVDEETDAAERLTELAAEMPPVPLEATGSVEGEGPADETDSPELPHTPLPPGESQSDSAGQATIEEVSPTEQTALPTGQGEPDSSESAVDEPNLRESSEPAAPVKAPTAATAPAPSLSSADLAGIRPLFSHDQES